MDRSATARFATHRSRGGIRELTRAELSLVSGGDSCGPGDCGSDSAADGSGGSIGTLSEVTVTGTPDSDGTSGNPMNLIPSGLGLLGATIGIIVATTPLAVGLATIAAAAAVMNAVVNNNASLPQVPQWNAPSNDIPAGP